MMQKPPPVPRLPKVVTDPTIKEFRVTRVVAGNPSPFPGCVVHRLIIEAEAIGHSLVIQSKGRAPQLGARLKRKRLKGGFAVVWSNPGSDKVDGGGWTAGVVPDDWRRPQPEEITP